MTSSRLAAGLSDRGRVRKKNEDSYRIADEIGLYVVCDGLGGHAAGEEASRRAVEIVVDFVADRWETIRASGSTPGGYFRCTQMLEEAVQSASTEICRLAKSSPRFAGMATTMTVLLLVDRKGVMAHVGDTRLYLLRQGRLHLLSTDHTLAEELARAGTLERSAAAESRYANVLTRSVGSQEAVEVETLLFDLLAGDSFLLASDGLTYYFEDDAEITSYLEREDLDETAAALVELANKRGGRDNVTLVLVRFQSLVGEPRDEASATQRRIEALEAAFPFEGLSLSRLARILAAGRERSFGAAQTLVGAGEECEGLWVVVEGRVRLARPDEPEQELTSEDSFGELALLRARPALASAVAVEPSTLVLVDRDSFRRLRRRRPRLGALLTSRLVTRMSQSLEGLGPHAEVAAVRRSAWF